jgi:alkylation response protein AidB-like acyl-CoA dehydrogenase
MTDTLIDIDQFRREARAWIESHLEPRPQAKTVRVSDAKTDEDIVEARVLQRRLFDAGYAGISYPVECGGRGLTVAHERAFREEAAGYVTPDLGVAGNVTYGPIARSILAHA